MLEEERLFQRKEIFIEQFFHEVKINERFGEIQNYVQELVTSDRFIREKLEGL